MSKDTLQDFALRHKCSMLDTDRLIRELIGELEEVKDRLKKLEGDSDKTVDNTNAAEPLIKDKKIRKALRAWAEACNIPNDVQLDVFEYLGTEKTAIQYTYEAKTKPYKGCVQFEYISSDKVYSSQNDRKHTITELCGEGEE